MLMLIHQQEFSVTSRVKTYGWRLPGCNQVIQPKLLLPRLSATYLSLSASTSEQLSWRLMSEPRKESSGGVYTILFSLNISKYLQNITKECVPHPSVEI